MKKKPTALELLHQKCWADFAFGKLRNTKSLWKILGREDLGSVSEMLTHAIFHSIFEEFKNKPPPVVEPPSSIVVEQSSSYFIENLSNRRCKLEWFQRKAAQELCKNFLQDRKGGQLLTAATGLGKTIIAGEFIAQILHSGILKGCVSPMPIVYITRDPVVVKTKRALKKFYGLDLVNTVHVINIEKLRSSFGEMLLKEVIHVIGGEEHIEYVWHPNVYPRILIIDECHLANNPRSKQSRILQAYNDIWTNFGKDTHVMMMSATPFSRVCEAKVFAVGTHKKMELDGVGEVEINNENWSTIAKTIASPAEPEEYVLAAVDRLYESFKDHIVEVKNVRMKFKSHNNVCVLKFRNPAQRESYNRALLDYHEEVSKMESRNGVTASEIRICKLVAWLKFRMRAELLRAEYLAELGHKAVQEGRACGIGCNFQQTICEVVRIWVEKYGVSRDKISLVWGGYSEKQLSQKAALKKSILDSAEIMAMIQSAGLDMEELGLAGVGPVVERKEYDPKLRLGKQSKKQRQIDIDNYQSGRNLYFCFTFKAGGTGLDAHHEVPESRPRRFFHSPTYSEREIVQAFGRGHRYFSLSDTDQYVLLFEDTIEEHVMGKMKLKLSCLKGIVRGRESWEDLITKEKVLINEEEEEEDEVSMIEEEEEQEVKLVTMEELVGV